MRIASAFLLRDLRIAWSYRFSFLVQNVSLLFSLLSLKFIAQLFGASAPAALKTYGGEYFSFALLGTCVTLFSYPAVRSFAQGVRAAQTTGTFEVMLTTRARPSVIVLSAGLYPILFVCLQALAALLIGWLLLGARLQAGQLLLALAVFAMFLVSLVGLGLISAAFVVAFRQTEPLTSALISVSVVVSGVLYPTSVLPSWLSRFAVLLPTTHALELARGLLLRGASVSSLSAHAAALGVSCLTLPVGLAVLSLAIAYAKRTGTLAHY